LPIKQWHGANCSLKNKNKKISENHLIMRRLLVLCCLLSTLSLFAAEKWITYKIAPGFSPKNDITAIAFDKAGSWWVATSYGVYKKEGEAWRLQGKDSIYVQTLYIAPNDTKWVGLWGGGVFKCESGQTWEYVKEASPTNSVNVISGNRQGNIWIGDWGGGAVNLNGNGEINTDIKTGGAIQYNGQKWINYKAEQVKLGDNSVVAIACDLKNRMWLGTYHGLSLVDKEQWTLFNTENSRLPDNDVYSLAADANGNLWAGTCDGLAKINNSKWEVYRKQNCGLPDNLILAIAVDKQGNVWVGTNNGAARFNGKQWKVYTTENSELLDNRIQGIAVHDGAIYFCTSRGLSVLSDSE
jgi:ligand-binding sensor domain-containing protein